MLNLASKYYDLVSNRFKFLMLSGILILIISISPSCRKSDYLTKSGTITICDDGSGIGTMHWTSNKTYILDGLVFVNDGQTLIIDPGTIIQAKTGQGDKASALIIARGGKIIAEGTPDKPIIFTVEDDDLEGSIPIKAKGLWGGLIILGNAQLNTEANEASIEGIPFSEPRGVYGGFDDADNSGILKYVSIRHGGTNIGEGNEINGLTLGGVGNETTIDYVEIISNKDDGIEFFGGNVNCKHIAVIFCGDDCFDFDNGYRGLGQFWLAIQDPNEGDLISEHDGGSSPITGMPLSIPKIFNATFIGRGSSITNHTIAFRENAGGFYANSIIINQGSGIEIEYTENRDNSYTQFLNNNLEIRNNLFYNIADNRIFSIIAESEVVVSEYENILNDYFSSANNFIADPGIEITEDYYQIIPMNNYNENLFSYPDTWFDQVDYRGAFGYYNWLKGWSLFAQTYILD